MENIAEKLKQIGRQGIALQREVRTRTVGYVVAGLSVVIGLAWNDAIKTAIEYVFPAQGNTVIAKFVYALILTLSAVTLAIYLERLGEKK